jgi:hypothetical protein
MIIWAWTTTYWTDIVDARAKGAGAFGLSVWYDRVWRYFKPDHYFLACGTWSNPLFSPLPSNVEVVNAGVKAGTPYDIYYSHLSGCALTAAMAYALNRSAFWDLLVLIDTDTLIGAVDFDALLREFMARDEVLLAQAWWDGIGGPFWAWKREGAIRTLHSRLRANLIDPPTDQNTMKPMLIENELAAMFKGRWWNPWQQFKTMRQDFGLSDPRPDSEAMTWPFVGRPSPTIIEEYERTQTALAKPVA